MAVLVALGRCMIDQYETGARLCWETNGPGSAVTKQIIDEFRAGNLTMLCNYGVLTTGFDAPKIENVVIARPTTSAVLYEQMIGRGTRGPLNGGTPHCLIIDVKDNIENFGEQMAYTRYLEYWN